MSEAITEDDAVSTADLQRMLDESRAEKEAIRRERDDALSRVRHTERERDTAAATVLSETERRFRAESESVAAALAAAKSDADRAEAEYVRAMEASDYAAAARAQRAISEAAARHTNYDARREFLEANKEQLTRPPEQQRHRQDSGDRYSGVVADLLPTERQWLDARPQFLSDTKYRQRVLGASQLAAAEHTRGSPEYFREIERIVGEVREEAPARQEAAPPRERQASSDLTPQRRPAPGAQPSGSKDIRLSADQVEVADSLYGNPSSPDYIADQGERYRKYAGNLERMRASGRL